MAESGIANPTVTIILNGVELFDTISTIVQAQLAEVGITVEVRPFPPAGAAPAFRTGEGGAYLSSAQIGGDPMTFLAFNVFGIQNPGGLWPEVQQLYAELQQKPFDDPARDEILQDINRRLADQVVQIPWVQVSVQYLSAPGLVGLGDSTFTQANSAPDLRIVGVEKSEVARRRPTSGLQARPVCPGRTLVVPSRAHRRFSTTRSPARGVPGS